MTNERPVWRPPDQQSPSLPGSPPPPQPDSPPMPPGHQDLPQSAGPGWAVPPGTPPAAQPGYDVPPAGPPRSGSRRTAIIVGVIVLVVIVLVVLVVLLGLSLGSSIGNLGTRTPIEQVAVGQCFNGIRVADFEEGQQISPGMLFGVEVIPCAEPHEGELIARPAWPSDRGDDYPGDQQIETFTFNACATAFEEYVGIPFGSSRYELTYLFPQARSWADGTRTAECIVHPPIGVESEAGSVRGANR